MTHENVLLNKQKDI